MKLVTKIIHDNTTLDSKNKIKSIDSKKVASDIYAEVLKCLFPNSAIEGNECPLYGLNDTCIDVIKDNLTYLFEKDIV